MKTITQLKNLKDKKILLRVDLNSNIVKGKVLDSERFSEHAKTIKYLLKKKAKVIILAHQGSPGKSNCISLKQHSEILKKRLGNKIKFCKETIGNRAWLAISQLKSGQAVLLENTRFLKDEFSPRKDNDFVNFFKEAGINFFVQDAFSILHRKQTSILSMPKVFPSAIGPVLENELSHIEKLKPKLKRCLFILGGNKTKDLLPLLNNRILTTGKLSLVALKAREFKLTKLNGLSNEDFNLAKKLKNKKLGVPIDLGLNIKGKRKNISLTELPQKHPVWDIGKKTIDIYKNKIAKENAVFIKGAAGMFESPAFALGTREILKAAEKSRAFTIVAGGSMSDAVKKFKINKKRLGYVSLSGGSLVKYLAGEKLPGLRVLK